MQDILGVEPIAEAVKITIEKSLDGISSFLEIVCKPCLEEIGLMAKDQLRAWRLSNIQRILKKSKDKLYFDGQMLQLKANARVALSIINEGSQIDNEELQDLWAGLFSSSCTEDGQDDSNIIFVDLLKRMSVVEARILKYACENCNKLIFPNGLIVADDIKVSFPELKSLTGIDDIYRLDRELDHMNSISLFSTSLFGSGPGFNAADDKLDTFITPSALGLNLYYKTHAHNTTPPEFWKDKLIVKEYEPKHIFL